MSNDGYLPARTASVPGNLAENNNSLVSRGLAAVRSSRLLSPTFDAEQLHAKAMLYESGEDGLEQNHELVPEQRDVIVCQSG